MLQELKAKVGRWLWRTWAIFPEAAATPPFAGSFSQEVRLVLIALPPLVAGTICFVVGLVLTDGVIISAVAAACVAGAGGLTLLAPSGMVIAIYRRLGLIAGGIAVALAVLYTGYTVLLLVGSVFAALGRALKPVFDAVLWLTQVILGLGFVGLVAYAAALGFQSQEIQRRVLTRRVWTREEREQGWKSAGKKCNYCNVKLASPSGQDMHLDHYIPLAKGGADELSNIVAACLECNLSKGTKHPSEFNPTKRGWWPGRRTKIGSARRP